MKDFSRHRTYTEVHDFCTQAGVPCDESDYLLGGAQITVGVVGSGHVTYDVETGEFTGTTPEGMSFSDKSVEYDGHPWYDAVLALFYVE